MADLTTALAGVPFQNPLIAASGTFGFGAEFACLWDLNQLGGIALKGTTLAPRAGNPLPRVTECPAGMLNAVGLENPGLSHVLAEALPALAAHFRQPILANLCGFSVEEYAECAARFDASPHVALLEVNISCPNVRHGGMSFGTDPQAAAAVTRACRAVSQKPLFVKLSPNVTDIVEIARACADAGADGLSLINTPLGMRIDLRTRRPVLANITGGLSGPAILPIALRMVYQVYAAARLPIVGMGGVSTAADVIEMMLAGASAVQAGTASLADPYALPKILAQLPEEMDRLGIHALRDIIGAAHQR